MTGHVAQGTTVDRCFVLASEGMSREWAYVALSRGRLSNRLYIAARPDDAREEFAPVERDARDPVERLAAAVRDGEGQVLAIDTGRELPSDNGLELQVLALRATREREALERRGHLWLPGRRRALAEAQDRERAASAELRQLRRKDAELRHATRSFVTEKELEARGDVIHRHIAERATERVHERAIERHRSIGSER
jgi:hypothetical protein